MKAYTDIEQSKKLAYILPLESADMFYDGVQDSYKEKVYNIPINGSSITVRTGHIITKKSIKANLLLPCWSLAALYAILPNNEKESTILSRGEWRIYLNKWWCDYENESHTKDFSVSADNPVDACVEMILKLHELNLL